MRPRGFFKNSVTVVAFFFSLCIASWAQQYQILQARYGTAENNVDVTQRLRELASRDVTFRMGNSTFGVDPAPGQLKTLRIYASDNSGNERMFEYREGSTIEGSQFSGWGNGNWGMGNWNGGWYSGSQDAGQYQILHARYGVPDRSVDVTQRLRELASRDVAFRMGNSTFGVDPAPGQVKTLRIYARDMRGGRRVFDYREGSTVDGSLFSGWTGGNWGNGGWRGRWDDDGDNDDSGEYQIMRAFYGTADHNVDVTQRLRELASRDVRFRMGNSTFNIDPAPGHVKTLRIYARSNRDGSQRTFEYREGSTIDGSMFSGWRRGNWGQGDWNGGWDTGWGNTGQNVYGSLNILRATYGAGGRSRDVTNKLRSLVRSDRLDLRIGNSTFDEDPAPGKVKMLYVTYTVGSGRQQQVQVREGDQLRIP